MTCTPFENERPTNAPLERLIPLVTQVIARDQAAYGNQFPAFREEPASVLLGILESLTSDAATGQRYMRFCQSLIWGETPSYSEVAGTFVTWAREALGVGSRKDGCDEPDMQMA